MKYQKVCYKYRLYEDYADTTRILDCEYEDQYAKITKDGRIIGKKGFCWDGCSGPTKDDDTNQVPGLLHDIKYYLMRIGVVPQSWRHVADKELVEGCRKRGMSKFRAWYYFEGVDHFAGYAAKYGSEPKILTID
jgi:hypothetical protein